MPREKSGWRKESYRHSLACRGIETRKVVIKTGDYPPSRKELDIKYDPEKAKLIIIRYMASSHYQDPEIPTKLKMEELLNRFSDDDVKDLIRLYYTDRSAFMQEVGKLGYGKVRISGQAFVPELEKQKVKAERKASAPEHKSFNKLSKTQQRKLKLLEKEEVPGALFQVTDVEKLWDESSFDGRNHLLVRASAAMKKKRMKYKKVTQEEKDAVSRAEDAAERAIYRAEMQRIKDVEDKEDY